MADTGAATDRPGGPLSDHFKAPYSTHNDKWDGLWKSNFIPFDRGQPNPALFDTLNDRQDVIGKPLTRDQGRRKRALVPGCGKGYDVLLLASYGYDAYGLEVSPSALKACEEYANKEFANYTSTKSETDLGSYTFILGDFFKSDWLEKLPFGTDGFDLIYDYTFFCALPPEIRPHWALRHSQLLAPGHDSHLICLEFPTFKDPSVGGPPFGLSPDVYVAHLTRPGEELPYDKGYPKSVDPASGNDASLVRIAHWQPERTHKVGQGTDYVSVWQHK